MPVRVMRTIFSAALIVLLARPPMAHGQSLGIQGIDLAIGMDRQTVLARLKSYQLHCVDQSRRQATECDSLLVQNQRPPYQAHGNVVFEGGRVKSIRKYWSRGYEGSAPGKFVQTLYTLLSSTEQQGSASFRVSVAERRDPGVVQQTIFLSSGRRTISISYGEGLRGADGATVPPYVTLDEMIE